MRRLRNSNAATAEKRFAQKVPQRTASFVDVWRRKVHGHDYVRDAQRRARNNRCARQNQTSVQIINYLITTPSTITRTLVVSVGLYYLPSLFQFSVQSRVFVHCIVYLFF